MDIEREAERARALLNDDLWKQAIEEIRERQRAAFENSTPEQSDVRERAYHMLKALKALDTELRKALGEKAILDEKVRKRGND